MDLSLDLTDGKYLLKYGVNEELLVYFYSSKPLYILRTCCCSSLGLSTIFFDFDFPSREHPRWQKNCHYLWFRL